MPVCRGSSVRSSTQSETTAQQAPVKDAKANSNPTLSHSHSMGATTRHKHQQLHKSHSHSPSHGTGATSNSSHFRSSSSRLASKELSASHHSRTKSGPLSPTHTNEPSSNASKRQTSSNSGHNRSNSGSKSIPSLSPKSTLSGSSSSGSLKHDVENEITSGDTCGDITASVSLGEGDSGEPSLNSSREEGEEDMIDDNERGKGETVERGGGGWCQIEEMSEAKCATVSRPNESLEQNEVKEMKEVASGMAEVVLDEREKEREDLPTVGDGRPSSDEPKTSSQQKQSEQEETEDSSIVKG